MTQSIGPNASASIDEDGNGVFIEFVRQGDRYGHHIGVLAGGIPHATLLTSIEHAADAEDALQAPALQEHSVSSLPDRRSASALLGMSGARHWSLTVEADPAADRPRIVLDYACRARECPAGIGNRYAIAPEVDFSRVDSGILLTADSRAVRLGVCSIFGWPETEASVSGRELHVVCKWSKESAELVTIRWRYVVEWMDAADLAQV